MDPAQLLVSLRKGALSAGYAFLGNELWTRDGCRRALAGAVFPDGDPRDGLSEYDLAETPLETVVGDARTLSLFAPARLIVASNAEALLARRAEAAEEAAEESSAPAVGLLERYFRDPTPGVVLLFEAVRFDWDDRDEKKKLERLAALLAATPVKVEMRRLDHRAALEGARALARQNSLPIADALLAELAEALGFDMARIANEIAKLAVWAQGGCEITREKMAELVPEARTSGLFELTDALASRDRKRALEILDTLVKMEVYLPLQLSFLGGLFRQALAVKESGARSTVQVTRLFEKLGLPAWAGRVRQALETANRFSQRQLEEALVLLFQTDRDLRRDRIEERILMERLVWALTR